MPIDDRSGHTYLFKKGQWDCTFCVRWWWWASVCNKLIGEEFTQLSTSSRPFAHPFRFMRVAFSFIPQPAVASHRLEWVPIFILKFIHFHFRVLDVGQQMSRPSHTMQLVRSVTCEKVSFRKLNYVRSWHTPEQTSNFDAHRFLTIWMQATCWCSSLHRIVSQGMRLVAFARVSSDRINRKRECVDIVLCYHTLSSLRPVLSVQNHFVSHVWPQAERHNASCRDVIYCIKYIFIIRYPSPIYYLYFPHIVHSCPYFNMLMSLCLTPCAHSDYLQSYNN